MKRLVILTIATLFSWIGYAQPNPNPPDFDRLEVESNNPMSPFYHPFLMSKYEASDTTLTLEDYYHLYYGYATQPNYKPLLPNEYSDSLMMLLSGRSTPSNQIYKSVISLTHKILAQNPFSLRDINALAFALKSTGEDEKARLEMRKVTMLKQVIQSSGTGLSESSPWYVIMPENSYDIVSLDGFNVAQRIIATNSVEFLQVTNATNKQIKGFYFNFAAIYKRKPNYL